jgi:hypothetical protein
MAKFVLEIDCDGAAFDDCCSDELQAILQQAALQIRLGRFSWQLTDTNGNRVGGMRFDPS